jgi:hypothetical protein
MSPSPSDKKFFPEELRRYSEVCKELDKSDDNKIFITSTQLLYKEIHKSLKFYNQGCKKRGVVILKNPPKPVNGLSIPSQGTHWDIHQASTDSDDIQHTRIIGNGYCALVTAIVAKGIFDDQFDSNEFIDSLTNPKDLKNEFYNNWKRILDICPDEIKDDVKALMNSGASSETWLDDDVILKIINHNIKNPNNLPTPIFENSFLRSAHFERKIAFLRHSNQADDDEFLNMIKNGLGGITLGELLSGSGEMNADELKLYFDVLKQLTKLLNVPTNKIGVNQINPEAVINFYNLMPEAILELNLNEKNCIKEEEKIKLLQDSFNAYFESEKTDASEENKKKYQSQKNTTRERLLEKLSDPIKKQKESFLKKITKKVDEDKDKDKDKDYYYILLKDASDKFGGNDKDDFKSKISKLENTKLNNHMLDDVYRFLLRNDSTFLEAMLPDSNQLKPQFSFSGWGKKIEFSDCKITFGGNEVVGIYDGNEEEVKENIISKLCKDYQGDPKRFQLGVIDFFRNTKSAELVYDDKTLLILEEKNKKMFKYNLVDGRDEFQVVENDDRQKEEEEKKEINHFKTRLDAYLNPQKPRVQAPPTRYPPPPPPRHQKGVTGVGQPNKETKKKMLAEIEKHIDLRFELLDNLLERDKDIMVIIPGSCKKQPNGKFNLKHSLGTDLAKGQWRDIGLANEGEECVEYIYKKIINLCKKNQGRVLFGNIGGNIGIKAGSSGAKTFHPQFPLYDAPYENLKDLLLRVKDDDEGLKLLERNYLDTYAQLGKDIPDVLGVTNIKDKIESYQEGLFGESGILKVYKFVHVFGANSKNVNNEIDVKIEGGGQVKALENQQMGIFGIVTTPKEIFKVEHFEKLHEVCKTYGPAESQKKQLPNPSLKPQKEAEILKAENKKEGQDLHLG